MRGAASVNLHMLTPIEHSVLTSVIHPLYAAFDGDTFLGAGTSGHTAHQSDGYDCGQLTAHRLVRDSVQIGSLAHLMLVQCACLKT